MGFTGSYSHAGNDIPVPLPGSLIMFSFAGVPVPPLAPVAESGPLVPAAVPAALQGTPVAESGPLVLAAVPAALQETPVAESGPLVPAAVPAALQGTLLQGATPGESLSAKMPGFSGP